MHLCFCDANLGLSLDFVPVMGVFPGAKMSVVTLGSQIVVMMVVKLVGVRGSRDKSEGGSGVGVSVGGGLGGRLRGRCGC